MSFNGTNTIMKYKKALGGFADIYNTAKRKDKQQYIKQVRKAGISFKDAKNIGFKVTSWMWKRCLNTSRRNNGKSCLFMIFN